MEIIVIEGRLEGIEAKPDAVLLNGDTLDFYAMSDHEKDPRKVRWNEELEACRAVLKMIRKAFPSVPIYFKSGNHEYRMERHLMKHQQRTNRLRQDERKDRLTPAFRHKPLPCVRARYSLWPEQ